VCSDEIYAEIISRSDVNKRKLALLDSTLLAELNQVNMAIAVFRSIEDGNCIDQEADKVLSQQLALTSTQISDLTSSISEITDPKLFSELADKAFTTNQSINDMLDRCRNIASVYHEVVEMRKCLQQAISDEKSVRFRIATNLESLQGTSQRISEELAYIKGERDKLRLKAESGFPCLPLMDVIDGASMCDSSAWRDLSHKGFSLPIHN
jgi:predicted DNA-binding protein YlxM (UPF0122 family)